MRSFLLKTRRRPKGTEVPRGRDKHRKAGRAGGGDNGVADQEQGSKRGASDHPRKRNGREKDGYKPEACEKGLPDGEPKARTKGEKPDNKHGRLFIEAELDRLERGEYGTAAVELEKYDKEQDERLFPLDEVELIRRMKENADGHKDLSIEELSKGLEIPAEVLERIKAVATGALSTPEYSLDWYGERLATVDEAKRANRNFKGSEESRASSSVTSNTRRVQHHDRVYVNCYSS
ncbi:hypothetical protein JG688_00004237 [Phytophthora aleatoria]|uniref:Uncharacterized protein n=1 Tax=Phytophthora aleatoria TaxID=2496075 RepID=A0A8J5IXA1_9STRA|nr:hypothetical protein JG688_00004237 [Phytophthora aleatoria]